MNVLNKIMDFPGMVNDKLPGNIWKNSIESSENELNSWIGKLLQLFSVVFVVMSVVGIGDSAIDAMDGAEGMTIVGSIVTMLLFIYAAFPISQFIRSAGDALASSRSGIIEFLLKDLVIAILKLSGYSAAMIGLTAAASGVVSFLVDAPVFAYEFDGISTVGVGLMVGILTPLADLAGAGGIMGAFEIDSYSFIMVDGLSKAGALQVLDMIIQPLMVLILLYITLAVYHFMYGLGERFLTWVKGPYLPFKSL